MKKKILFITEALWIGGIETALVNLLNHLDYNKYEISCLITKDYQSMAGEITPQCRLIVADRHHTVSFSEPYRHFRLFDLTQRTGRRYGLRKAISGALSGIFRPIEARLYCAYLRRAMAAERYDTAVIYSDRTSEIAVRSICADRFLMFYHNADLGRAYHDTLGYRKSEKIIAVSEKQCQALKELRPRFADKMIAVHNLIDTKSILEKAHDVPEKPYLATEGFHIVSCGRLAVQKGFDLAVEACAMLVFRGHSTLKWHVFGEGPQRGNLQALIRKYGMEEHFFLHGIARNPFPYMKKSDLYVQTSRTEGYSLSILEARVLACPTVATRGAAEEQLEDGITGTLCESNARSICDAIEQHLREPERSARYHMALSEYSFDAENKGILRQIEALL